MTSKAYELKNAYIGGDTGFEYSYDFKNKSAASITADWWRIPWNTPSFNSNWMYYSSWSAGVVYDFKDWVFSNANKITGTLNFIITNSSKHWESLQLEPIWLSTGFWNNDYWWFNNHNYFEERFNGATTYGWISSRYANWTYTEKVVYDLINKTVSYTWPTTSTRTLTDTQISQIRALCAVYILVADNGVTISSVSVEVE